MSGFIYDARPIPEFFRPHLTSKLKKCKIGRDHLYKSEFLNNIRNNFAWKKHNATPPNDDDLYHWAMAVGKSSNKDEKSKKNTKNSKTLINEIREELFNCMGNLRNLSDKFIGHPFFHEIEEKFSKKGVSPTKVACAIHSIRKKTRTSFPGWVYLYQVAPTKDPAAVKYGWTEGARPYNRMKANRTTKSEKQEKIAYFPANRDLETEFTNAFKCYRKSDDIEESGEEVLLLDTVEKIDQVYKFIKEKGGYIDQPKNILIARIRSIYYT